MPKQILTPEQIDRLKEVESPTLRRRFTLYHQLPQDLQESMFAESTAGSVWSITKEKYGLEEEKVTAVARAIGLVFLGELPIKNFVRELVKSLNVDAQKATNIARDVNQTIFQPVRESLMEVHGIAEEIRNEKRETGSEEREIRSGVRPPMPLEEIERRRPVFVEPPIEESVELPKPTPRQRTYKNGSRVFRQSSVQAERRRKELLEKLRQNRVNFEEEKNITSQRPARPATVIDLSKKSVRPDKPNQPKPEATPTFQQGSGQAAWNGKTINLRNIPPRRVSPRKKFTRLEA